MADKVATAPAARSTTAPEKGADEAERALGRALAIALPTVTVVAFIAMCILYSIGPALLVLAAGTILGVIALLWASLRTLSGDAPLDEGLVAVNVATRGTSSDSPAERKRRVMRALKDLEHEHAIGKLDDADYAQIAARYREEAKEILREMDVEIEPLRAKAEELARAHLAKKGLLEDEAPRSAKARDEEREEREEDEKPARPLCAKCETSNDADAAFCKKCGAPLNAPAEAKDAS